MPYLRNRDVQDFGRQGRRARRATARQLIMSQQLAYVIVTPYSLYKSRTGGILSRLISRTGLDLAAAMAVEQAKLDLFGVCRKQREIASAPVPCGSQRMRRTGRNPHTTAPEREKLSQGAEQQG